MEALFDELWPLPRSITGPGFVESLDIIGRVMPTERLAFATGEQVLDWTVPKEWIPREAWFVDPHGVKHADFGANNLHLVSYSAPCQAKMPLSELREHIHALPDQPNAIPYVTSYYQERWGFCLSHEEFAALPDGEYEVHIDTELKPGQLVVGEAVLPGKTDEEVFFSSYLCHPSMANDQLSGPIVLAFLYGALSELPDRRYTYRFVLCPETIGAIAYLGMRGKHLTEKMVAGYQLACLADGGPVTYKTARTPGSLADRAALCRMREMENDRIIPFNPAVGSDERQYGSPGFDLPVGSFMRTMYTDYPGYHTSLDNKDLVDFNCFNESVDVCLSVARALEENETWVNQAPFGEPQLGRRGLYRSLSMKGAREEEEQALWWLLNLADGSNDLLAIAGRSGLPLDVLASCASTLHEAGLLTRSDHGISDSP